MNEDHTTAAVQRFIDALAGDTPAEPIIRALLDRAVGRLEMLCAGMLYSSYPRLTRPPLNLETDELLGAVVERLLKAMRAVRPRTVREFFALANQHMRWELNDLARRLDEQPAAVELREGLVPAPASSGSELTPDARRILEAIDALPADEREAFGLVRIQGLTQPEAAEVLRRVDQDGAAAAQSRAAVAGGAAGRPPADPGAAAARRRPGPASHARRRDRGRCAEALRWPASATCETCSRRSSNRVRARRRCARATRSCWPRSGSACGNCAGSRPSSMRCSPRHRPRARSRAVPLQVAAAEPPHLSGYEVQDELGRGGMGVVYRAWDRRLHRPVALKMLLAGDFARPDERERFRREAEAAAGLRHANIVQVYHVGDLDGRPYFTMEFVEGGSLAEKLAGAPLPAGQAAALLATLAEAVQAAHDRGIVHRDLKPAQRPA